MAAINFNVYNGEDFSVNLAGSGIGAFGSSFGNSVQVGEYNDTLYITDSNGIQEGGYIYTVKYTAENSGLVSGMGDSLPLLNIPNYQAPIKISFSHDESVNVQNASLLFYDRSSISNPPSGVTVKACEVIHDSTSQEVVGSGDHTWYTGSDEGVTIPLADSPGPSGMYAASGTGSTYAGTEHDWFVLFSCSPDSVGSKTQFAAYVSTEYL
jgi:hypothetical protein